MGLLKQDKKKQKILDEGHINLMKERRLKEGNPKEEKRMQERKERQENLEGKRVGILEKRREIIIKACMMTSVFTKKSEE